MLPGVLRLWKQAALVNIGSLKQQAYVTYLAYHLILKPGSIKEEDDDVGTWVREGIELRIGKVQSEKIVYDMGLLVWKAYM